MAENRLNDGFAGGIFVALGPLIGLGVGWLVGQPSLGLLAGLALGIAMAIAMWLVTRSRSND